MGDAATIESTPTASSPVRNERIYSSVKIVTRRGEGLICYRNIRVFPMSDFVYPAYFEAFQKPGSMQFDWMDEAPRPFEIKPGGCQQLNHRGRWTNHTVALRTKRRLAAEDRRYHRSELRKRPGVRRRSSAR